MRMDLGEQAANAVTGLGDLGSQIVVEASQHGEFGEWFVSESQRAGLPCFPCKK